MRSKIKGCFYAVWWVNSSHVREPRTVLDSGLHTVDFGFQVLNYSICIKRTWILGPVSRKARKLFGSEGTFKDQNLLNRTTVPSSQTGQCCFVNWSLHFIIFRIIHTLIWMQTRLQLSEKFPGLSRNGALDSIVGFRIPWYGFWSPKPGIPDSVSKSFPELRSSDSLTWAKETCGKIVIYWSC